MWLNTDPIGFRMPLPESHTPAQTMKQRPDSHARASCRDPTNGSPLSVEPGFDMGTSPPAAGDGDGDGPVCADAATGAPSTNPRPTTTCTYQRLIMRPPHPSSLCRYPPSPVPCSPPCGCT